VYNILLMGKLGLVDETEVKRVYEDSDEKPFEEVVVDYLDDNPGMHTAADVANALEEDTFLVTQALVRKDRVMNYTEKDTGTPVYGTRIVR
jgi:nucleoside diphosphate kinase